MKQLHLGVDPPTGRSAQDIGEPEGGDRWMKPRTWGDLQEAENVLLASPDGWLPALIVAYLTAKRGRDGWWSGGESPRVLVVYAGEQDFSMAHEVDDLAAFRIPRTRTIIDK